MKTEIIKILVEKADNKNHGTEGCVFMSGATTITGNFYGFSVGATKPTSIVLTTSVRQYKLNAANLAITDELINFVIEGEYLPIQFTSITTTGSGYLKLWVK